MTQGSAIISALASRSADKRSAPVAPSVFLVARSFLRPCQARNNRSEGIDCGTDDDHVRDVIEFAVCPKFVGYFVAAAAQTRRSRVLSRAFGQTIDLYSKIEGVE